MKESIGYTSTLNIVIIFILISFAILMAIMSYSRAFKINNRIMNEIEKCEGYNTCTVKEINRILTNYGYYTADSNFNCPKRDGVQAIENPTALDKEGKPIKINGFEMCIYFDNDVNETKQSNDYIQRINGNLYYRYGVLTYYHVDLPLIEWFRLPVFTRTNWIRLIS